MKFLQGKLFLILLASLAFVQCVVSQRTEVPVTPLIVTIQKIKDIDPKLRFDVEGKMISIPKELIPSVTTPNEDSHLITLKGERDDKTTTFDEKNKLVTELDKKLTSLITELSKLIKDKIVDKKDEKFTTTSKTETNKYKKLIHEKAEKELLKNEDEGKLTTIEKKFEKLVQEEQKRIDSDNKIYLNKKGVFAEKEIIINTLKGKIIDQKVKELEKEVERIHTELKQEKYKQKIDMMRDLIKEKILKTIEMKQELKRTETKINENKDLIKEITTKRGEEVKKLISETQEEKRDCVAFTVRPSRKYCVKRGVDKNCLEWKGVYRDESCLIWKGSECVKSEYKYDKSNSKYQCVSKDMKLKQKVCKEFKKDGTCKSHKMLFGVKECTQHKTLKGKIVCSKYEVFFPQYTCLKKFEGSEICQKRKFFQPKFFCQIYNVLDGSRYCSKLVTHYSVDPLTIECTLEDKKNGCLKQEIVNVKEEITKTSKTSRIGEIETIRKSKEEEIIEMSKKIQESKKAIKEFTEKIGTEKNRDIVKEIKMGIEKEHQKIKQTEKTVVTIKKSLTKISRIEITLKKEEDGETKITDQVLTHDKTMKKTTEQILEEGNKTENIEERTEITKKLTEKQERKIEEYERYLEEKRKADDKVISKMNTELIEQSKKLESEDSEIREEARKKVDDIIEKIEKKSRDQVTLLKEVVKKYREGTVRKFAEKIIEEKCKIIEEKLDIITKTSTEIKRVNVMIKNTVNKVILEELKRKVTGLVEIKENARKLRQFAVRETVSVVTTIKKSASTVIKGSITKMIEERVRATTKVDESMRKIVKIDAEIEAGRKTVETLEVTITSETKRIQKMSSSEEKNEAKSKLIVEQQKLDAAKRMISTQEESKLKETFTKWKNMRNAKLVEKEVVVVQKTLAKTIDQIMERIANFQREIRIGEEKITITANTQTVRAIKSEISQKYKQIIEANKEIEKQENRIIEAEKITIINAPFEESERMADRLVKKQKDLIVIQNGKITNAETIIDAQREIIKRNISKKETEAALKIIDGQRETIIESMKKVTKYSDSITDVKNMKIDKQISFIKKAKIQDAERLAEKAIKEISFTLVKVDAKEQVIGPEIKKIAYNLEKITDPNEVAKFERKLRSMYVSRSVIERERETIKMSMIKIKNETTQRIAATKQTIVAQETLNQIRGYIMRVSTQKKNVHVLMHNLKTKMAACKTDPCRRSLKISLKYEGLKYRSLETYQQKYRDVERVTMRATKKCTINTSVTINRNFEMTMPTRVSMHYNSRSQMSSFASQDNKHFASIKSQVETMKKEASKAGTKDQQETQLLSYCSKANMYWTGILKLFQDRVNFHRKEISTNCRRNKRCIHEQDKSISRVSGYMREVSNLRNQLRAQCKNVKFFDANSKVTMQRSVSSSN